MDKMSMRHMLLMSVAMGLSLGRGLKSDMQYVVEENEKRKVPAMQWEPIKSKGLKTNGRRKRNPNRWR